MYEEAEVEAEEEAEVEVEIEEVAEAEAEVVGVGWVVGAGDSDIIIMCTFIALLVYTRFIIGLYFYRIISLDFTLSRFT